MSDREKAIEAIKEALKDAAAEAGGYRFHLVISPALETALAALRAEEEREKGCVYCTGVTHDDCKAWAVWGWEFVDICFCPMCGRKLDGGGQDGC